MTWTPPKPSTQFTAASVYSWAGGFCVGMSEYFKIVGYVSDDPFASDTYKANFPRVPQFIGPSHSWPLTFEGKTPNVLYAAPPCSAWSPMGRSMFQGPDSWKTDPNADCTTRYLKYGLEMKPDIFVDESVPQILKSGLVETMASAWLDEGYAFTVVKFDGKFTSQLPQQRRRVFLVAHKVEIPWERPPFTGEVPTAGEALETAPPRAVPLAKADPLPDHWIEALHHADQKYGYGANLREAWEELFLETAEKTGKRVKGRPMFTIGRVDPNKPSGVIIGVQTYIHPFEDRWLSGREAARLCGYPDDYVWALEDDDGWTFTHVAKAVLPPAARWLGGNLARALTAGVPVAPSMRELTCWAPSPRLTDLRLQWEYRALTDPRLRTEPEPAESQPQRSSEPAEPADCISHQLPLDLDLEEAV